MTTCAVRPAGVGVRVRRVGVAVPAVVLAAGAGLALEDPLFGLFAGAIVLGWTRLVGL